MFDILKSELMGEFLAFGTWASVGNVDVAKVTTSTVYVEGNPILINLWFGLINGLVCPSFPDSDSQIYTRTSIGKTNFFRICLHWAHPTQIVADQIVLVC